MIDSPALLHLGGEKDIKLFELGRFAQVCGELPRSEAQTPRVVQFVGSRQRASAVKSLFPHNNLSRKKINSLASLRVDTASINHDSPLFFIESDPGAEHTDLLSVDRSHSDVLSLPLLRGQDPSTWNDVVHCRLLFLFADVVCLFLDDFADSESLSQRFQRWLDIKSASLLPHHLRPRLLLVTADPERVQSAETLWQMYQKCEARPFSSLQVVRLEGNLLSPASRVLRLRDVILSNSAEMHALREQHFVLFTAKHLQALFRAAAVHCSTSLQDPFDSLAAARQPLDNGDFNSHLGRYVALAQQHRIPYHEKHCLRRVGSSTRSLST